jgi:hypothetical protein
MDHVPIRTIGDRVRLMQVPGVQLQYQGAHGFVIEVGVQRLITNDNICAVRIHDLARPSIHGKTVYVSSASLEGAK